MDKECTKCLKIKNIDQFTLTVRKVPHVWCKECCKILYKEIRNKNKDKWTKSSIDPYLVNVEKKCSDCKTKQSRIQFNKDRTTRDGLSYHCKNCSKNRYKNNKISSPKTLMLAAAKQRAKRDKVICNITENDILIPERCPILNIPLKINIKKWENDSPSLDRIIPKLGYTKDNIKVISWRANALKRDASIEELESIVKYMKNN